MKSEFQTLMHFQAILLCLCCMTVLFSATTSCSSGCRSQEIPTPSAALNEALNDSASDPLIDIADELPEDWWLLFDDDQLTDFIITAFHENPTLQAARAKIVGAAYDADRVRAALFPNINWGADVSRQKFSETGIIPFNTSGTTVGMAPHSCNRRHGRHSCLFHPIRD